MGRRAAGERLVGAAVLASQAACQVRHSFYFKLTHYRVGSQCLMTPTNGSKRRARRRVSMEEEDHVAWMLLAIVVTGLAVTLVFLLRLLS